MGMSTHVVGFREPDATWDKMMAVYQACKMANIGIPDEVDAFFEGEDPTDLRGKTVKLGDACVPWRDDCREGFEVDLTKLPKGLRHIRFYNSW
jgi:hypothetical protein